MVTLRFPPGKRSKYPTITPHKGKPILITLSFLHEIPVAIQGICSLETKKNGRLISR